MIISLNRKNFKNIWKDGSILIEGLPNIFETFNGLVKCLRKKYKEDNVDNNVDEDNDDYHTLSTLFSWILLGSMRSKNMSSRKW